MSESSVGQKITNVIFVKIKIMHLGALATIIKQFSI
jgi:hypothetical protein